jgi:hypothetical protein
MFLLFGMQAVLLGSADMYRWAGPKGIPTKQYRGWWQLVRWPLLFFLGLGLACNLLIGLSLQDSEKILPASFLFTGMLLAITLLLVASSWIFMRGAVRYRRVADLLTGTLGQVLAVAYDSKDAQVAKHITNFLSTTHPIVAPASAPTVIELLSKNRNDFLVSNPEQVHIPILIGGTFSDLAPRAQNLQIVDWSDGTSNTRLKMLANALAHPEELASLLSNFPLRKLRTDPVKRASRRLRIIITLVIVPFVLWTMLVMAIGGDDPYLHRSFLIEAFDFIAPMMFIVILGFKLFDPNLVTGSRQFFIKSGVVSLVLSVSSLYKSVSGQFVFLPAVVLCVLLLFYTFVDRPVHRMLTR